MTPAAPVLDARRSLESARDRLSRRLAAVAGALDALRAARTPFSAGPVLWVEKTGSSAQAPIEAPETVSVAHTPRWRCGLCPKLAFADRVALLDHRHAAHDTWRPRPLVVHRAVGVMVDTGVRRPVDEAAARRRAGDGMDAQWFERETAVARRRQAREYTADDHP